MRCPNCGCSLVGKPRRCANCGKEMPPYDRLIRRSNELYNEGLELAQMRNLTCAGEKLEKALEYNKNNINARNLLGLVLYESGEMVDAIVQWVISTNLSPMNNLAEELLKKVQSNANEFREANTAIKKYNIALEMANKGSEDLAIIQLKKVIGINPHYVKALLLLSLLFIKNNDFEGAKRYAQRALEIDVGNVTARRYLNDIKSVLEGDSPAVSNTFTDINNERASVGISKSTHYKEDKPNYVAMVSFFVGLALGVVAVYFFAVSGIKAKLQEEQADETRKIGVMISEYQADISTLERDQKDLEAKIKALEKDVLYQEKINKELTEKNIKLEKQLAVTPTPTPTSTPTPVPTNTPTPTPEGRPSYEELLDFWEMFN